MIPNFPVKTGRLTTFSRMHRQLPTEHILDEDLEDLEFYQPGGYHPVHLGDELGTSGRYRVIHKLGHGGFGKVWLCRDTKAARYVVVKVMTADLSSDEILDVALSQLDQTITGAYYIALPLHHFSLTGPNGTHQCIVVPVLGPRVSPGLWHSMDMDLGPILRKMCYQAAQALSFLHQNGICHGDVRPANILVKLANLDDLGEEKILSLLGQPLKSEVLTEPGIGHPRSAPQYLVIPADLTNLGSKYQTEDICLIDFGESFRTSDPPTNLGTPENYLPPEVLLCDEADIGPATDAWALGCTIFEIREQIPLFYMTYDEDDLLYEMTCYFGRLPEMLWMQWEGRNNYFDANGQRLRRSDEAQTFAKVLAHRIEILGDRQSDGKGRVVRTFSVPEKEQLVLKDLLLKIFQYDPRERASITEVLEHEWFRM